MENTGRRMKKSITSSPFVVTQEKSQWPRTKLSTPTHFLSSSPSPLSYISKPPSLIAYSSLPPHYLNNTLHLEAFQHHVIILLLLVNAAPYGDKQGYSQKSYQSQFPVCRGSLDDTSSILCCNSQRHTTKGGKYFI